MSQSALVVVGGGLAGGLLAYRLARTRPEIALSLIESGSRLGGNHVWSFHTTDLTPDQRAWLAPFVVPLLGHPRGAFSRSHPPDRGRLSRDHFRPLHEVVVEALGGRARLGALADAVAADGVTLEGRRIEAACVVDARGLPAAGRRALGYQKFLGLRLRWALPTGSRRPSSWTRRWSRSTDTASSTCSPGTRRPLLVEDTRYSDSAAWTTPACGPRSRATSRRRGGAWTRSSVKRGACFPSPWAEPSRNSGRGSEVPRAGIACGSVPSDDGVLPSRRGGAPGRRDRRDALSREPLPRGMDRSICAGAMAARQLPSVPESHALPSGAARDSLQGTGALLPPPRGHDPPLLREEAHDPRPGAPPGGAPARAPGSRGPLPVRERGPRMTPRRAAVIGSGFGRACPRHPPPGRWDHDDDPRAPRPPGRPRLRLRRRGRGIHLRRGPDGDHGSRLPGRAVHARRPVAGGLRASGSRASLLSALLGGRLRLRLLQRCRGHVPPDRGPEPGGRRGLSAVPLLHRRRLRAGLHPSGPRAVPGLVEHGAGRSTAPAPEGVSLGVLGRRGPHPRSPPARGLQLPFAPRGREPVHGIVHLHPHPFPRAQVGGLLPHGRNRRAGARARAPVRGPRRGDPSERAGRAHRHPERPGLGDRPRGRRRGALRRGREQRRRHADLRDAPRRRARGAAGRAAPREDALRRLSLFVVYFGTRRRHPHLAHHNVLFGARYRELLADIFEKGTLADDFSLYLHAPTATDPSLAPPGCEAFYVLAPSRTWARPPSTGRSRAPAMRTASSTTSRSDTSRACGPTS